MPSIQSILNKIASMANRTGLFSIQKGEFFDTLTDITNKVQEVNDNVNSLAKSLIWQNPVANFAALATTYPTPEIGWAAMVTSLGFVYSWNGTAWKSTGLSSFPGDVETFIGVVSEKIATNELASNLIQRYYIDSVGHSDFDGGSTVNWGMTGLKKVNSGDIIYYNAYLEVGLNLISFYSSNSESSYVSGVAGLAGQALMSGQVTVPDGVNYVNCCFWINGSYLTRNSVFIKSPFDLLSEKTENMSSDVLSMSEKINPNILTNNLIERYYVGVNGISVHDGNAVVNWAKTGLKPVSAGDIIYYNGYSGDGTNFISFYSSNSESSYVSGVAGLSNGTLMNGRAIVPSGATYVQFCFWMNGIATTNSAYIKSPIDALTDKVALLSADLTGKKIMLYGDSISSTDYTWYKSEIERLTGATVYNGGFSGYSTAQLASHDCLQRALDYQPDIIIAMVGGNDPGAATTVGTLGTMGGLLSAESTKSIPSIASVYSGSSFIEATAYIMQYLSFHVCGFRHNAYLNGVCTDIGHQLATESDLDNVQKPLLIFCTPLPQQRYTSGSTSGNITIDSAQSNPMNHKRKRDAIVEAAEFLHIPLIDLSTLCGFSLQNESYWNWGFTGTTDKLHNAGTYLMDGLHPNKYGYARMAKIVSNFLKNYF